MNAIFSHNINEGGGSEDLFFPNWEYFFVFNEILIILH